MRVLTEMTPPEQRALHHLIDHGPSDLDLFKPEVGSMLVANKRAIVVDGRFAATDLGRFEVDRMDTIGQALARYTPSTRELEVSARGEALYLAAMPSIFGPWDTWRDLAAVSLSVDGWEPDGVWTVEDDRAQPRVWSVPLRHVDARSAEPAAR